MMRLKNQGPEVPPDGHRFTFPDGYVSRQSFYNDWLNDIARHYRDNQIERPENWVQIAEDQLCRLLPPGHCRQADGSNVMEHIDTRLHAFQIFHGAVVLANIVKEKEDALVPVEQAAERAAVCASCPANIQVEGCLPCLKISDVVMSVTGPRRETPSDHLLKSCACCGCPTRASTQIKIEILTKAMSAEMEARFALCKDWCWYVKEQAEMAKEST